MPRSKTITTTDHNFIRQWSEERGARPARVRGTGDEEDIGMIRLDFAGYSGEESLEEIGWDEWFEKFDESGLALVYQEETAQGLKSNFNKLISREVAEGGTPRRQAKKMQAEGRAKKSVETARKKTAAKTVSAKSKKAATSSRKTAGRKAVGRKATKKSNVITMKSREKGRKGGRAA